MVRVKCPCGSHLFFVQTPPPRTDTGLRKVWLICENCRKLWQLQDGYLKDVDETGMLKPERHVETEELNEAQVRGACQVLNGNYRREASE